MTMDEEHKAVVRCRCVACGQITMQPGDPDDRRHYVKAWFCGCSPRTIGESVRTPAEKPE